MSIPTTYRGVIFRSRLEATWAAFFDLLRWWWEYEPFERDGWIPDFALRRRSGAGAPCPDPVLVEVKPIFELDPGVTAKIDAADHDHEVLLVGIGPAFSESCGQYRVGWLRERGESPALAEPPSAWWGEAPLGRWRGSESVAKNPAGLFGFCHGYGSFRDRITGCYDGGRYGDARDVEIRLLWACAKNACQWRRGAA